MTHVLDALAATQLIAETAVREGWRPAALVQDKAFVNAVRRLGFSSERDIDAVLSFESQLEGAVRALGDNERSLAARLLVGMHPQTKGLSRKARRPKAARALLDVVEETFYKHYEPAIVADLAVEIYRLAIYDNEHLR